MTNRLFKHFEAANSTVTGERVGLEIETIFIDAATGAPISQVISRAMRTCTTGRPTGCLHTIDLSRANFELALGPCDGWPELLDLSRRSLQWLYDLAARHHAVPMFAPELDWPGRLVDVSTDPRDQLWDQLDGRLALEHLTCASVQLNVDVSLTAATAIINQLWDSGLHQVDFAPNDRRWRRYIAQSTAGYDPFRYAGPSRFSNLDDYVRQLACHPVVMNAGRIVRLDPLGPQDYDAEQYLRSVWWHYRLRVRGGRLVLECRPFARRGDDCLEKYWGLLAPVFNL